MGGPIRYVITAEHAEMDRADGLRDHDRATDNGWHGTGHMPPGGLKRRLAYKIMGYLGERAVSYHMGLKDTWVRDKDGFHKPDVGNYYVRTTDHHGAGLTINKTDLPEHAHILVWSCVDMGLSDLTFEIAGWLPPGVGKNLAARGKGKVYPDSGNCRLPATLVASPSSLERMAGIEWHWNRTDA